MIFVLSNFSVHIALISKPTNQEDRKYSPMKNDGSLRITWPMLVFVMAIDWGAHRVQCFDEM